MKYAVIDIGSNTIRLCAYEAKDGKLSLFLNQRVMACLGSKIQNGVLTQDGMEAACQALLDLQKLIPKHEVAKVFVFATAALRNIANTEEAVQTIKERTGFLVDVLSGEEEALFTFNGAAQEQHISDGLIADIGGGSTELILVQHGQVIQTASLPIGSLTAFVRFVGRRPATREQISTIRCHVHDLIAEHFGKKAKAKVLYGIGGAPRTALELEKILDPRADGAILPLEALLDHLLEDKQLAKKSILKASPERLDTALPGVAILCEVAAYFNCEKLDVCGAGVREGYLHKQLAAL